MSGLGVFLLGPVPWLAVLAAAAGVLLWRAHREDVRDAQRDVERRIARSRLQEDAVVTVLRPRSGNVENVVYLRPVPPTAIRRDDPDAA